MSSFGYTLHLLRIILRFQLLNNVIIDKSNIINNNEKTIIHLKNVNELNEYAWVPIIDIPK